MQCFSDFFNVCACVFILFLVNYGSSSVRVKSPSALAQTLPLLLKVCCELYKKISDSKMTSFHYQIQARKVICWHFSFTDLLFWVRSRCVCVRALVLRFLNPSFVIRKVPLERWWIYYLFCILMIYLNLFEWKTVHNNKTVA